MLPMGRPLNRSVCTRLLEVTALTLRMKLTEATAPKRVPSANLLSLRQGQYSHPLPQNVCALRACIVPSFRVSASDSVMREMNRTCISSSCIRLQCISLTFSSLCGYLSLNGTQYQFIFPIHSPITAYLIYCCRIVIHNRQAYYLDYNI